MRIKLTQQDLQARIGEPQAEYGKYVRPLINLANQIAKATTPKRVGQMTELIDECLRSGL